MGQNKLVAIKNLWELLILLLFIMSVKPTMVSPMQPRCEAPPAKEFPAFPHEEDMKLLAVAQNKFSLDFYLELAKGSGNVFFSPFSIMAAMTMVYNGAKGKTAEEIKRAMHLPDSTDSINNAFHDISEDYERPVEEYELRTSNRAYISNLLSPLQQFLTALTEKFRSFVEYVDFGKTEETRQKINAVVEKDTNNRIKQLIPQGVLTHMTRLVLVNAVYFKGFWEKQFKESRTKDTPFWTSATENVTVPMMHNKAEYRLGYSSDLKAKILALDYKGSRLSMVFVLPDRKDGLAELENLLGAADFHTLDCNLRSVEVQVSIPKFKLEELTKAKEILSMLGISDLFSANDADLSGIVPEGGLFVSHVLHKAFLEVNEEGSEAAAATAVVAQTRMAMALSPSFVADHPFLFFIRDYRSGLILFAGRYLKPPQVAQPSQ